MLHVMPRDGFTIWDPEQRNRLPAAKWRPVSDSRYWRRLAATGDVTLRDVEIVPAGTKMPMIDDKHPWDGVHRVAEEDVEGYTPPPKVIEPTADETTVKGSAA